MEKKHSAKFLRQRKMMMVLPLLVIPFVTMAFWALGGGKGIVNIDAKNNDGLNLKLPEAVFKNNKNGDKLAFYTEADNDSLKRQQLLRSDPYYNDSVKRMQDGLLSDTGNIIKTETVYEGLNYSPYNHDIDINEQRVYKKINELKKQINQPVISSASKDQSSQQNQPDESEEQFSTQVDRLQSMMQQVTDKPEADPEMDKLNSTLDKILDVQNPQRIRDKIKEKSLEQKEVVFPVSIHSGDDLISLLDTSGKRKKKANGFYGNDGNVKDEEENIAIEAVVNADQTLANGSVIKLRLATDIYINGTLIPKNNFVFGTGSMNDERLEIEINSIRNNKSIFPVKLEVYDMDGLPGIYIPGAITRDAAKQSADNGLRLMELSSMDPSLKAQAASAGINSVKSMLSRKVKQVKVMVKAGYKVLLKDQNIQQ